MEACKVVATMSLVVIMAINPSLKGTFNNNAFIASTHSKNLAIVVIQILFDGSTQESNSCFTLAGTN